MVDFFQKQEEQQIVQAIQRAEKNTSGEIRLHLEKDYKGDIMDAAAKVFHRLKMDRTELRNGVLIFMVPERRTFAILGDKGINEKVPEHFWEDVRDLLQRHFKSGAFTEGICKAIDLVGEKLKAYFPYQQDDENELPDSISYS